VRALDGDLSAEAESVMVARNAETGEKRVLTPAELESFARVSVT
jgi:hypothetical protein